MRSPARERSRREGPAGGAGIRVVLCLAVLGVLLLPGCASLLGRGDWDPFRSGDDRRLRVQVVNQNVASVRVVVVAPGRRVSLGTVAGSTRETFSVPWAGLQDLRFDLEAVGGERYTTPPLSIAPGERVELLVRSTLRQSAVFRR